MSLEKWVEYGWLRREPTSPGEIKDLLFLPDDLAHDAHALSRFQREAKTRLTLKRRLGARLPGRQRR
jgi:hypothetical protein